MAFAMDTGVENVVSIKVIGVGGGGIVLLIVGRAGGQGGSRGQCEARGAKLAEFHF